MKIIKLAILFLIAGSSSVYAQNIELTGKVLAKDKTILLCKPAITTIASTKNEMDFLKSIIKGNEKITYSLIQSNKDASNTHNVYNFSYKGIPIFGADYVVHSTNGLISFANGTIPNVQIDVVDNPKFNAESKVSN